MEERQQSTNFGSIALERRFITEEQLSEALRIQERETKQKGRRRYIGRILFEQGLLSISQIDEILNAMGKGPEWG